MQSDPTTHRLAELDPDECWELVTSQPVGRLAWAGPHGPTVIPVNFTVDGRNVRVRTTAYSEAARECDDSLVAFQVDNFEAADHTGWSVLMRGRGHLEYGGTAGDDGPEPWVRGPRTLMLRIEVTEVTGRRLVGS